MDLDGLISLVGRSRGDILPFVGSGLTLGAGAPSIDALARDLARRTGVDEGTLTAVTRDAEDRHGVAALQAPSLTSSAACGCDRRPR